MLTPSTSTTIAPNTVSPSIQYKPKDTRQTKIYNFLGDNNWPSWKEDIMLNLDINRLLCYAIGTILCPNRINNLDNYEIWVFNDKCTCEIICEQVKESHKFHILNCTSARHMWTNLETIHQPCSDHMTTHLMCEIYDHHTHEGDDIIAHLKALQQIWDHITLICPEDELQFTNKTFKLLLANSLPLTWDDYTCQFCLDPSKRDILVHT